MAGLAEGGRRLQDRHIAFLMRMQVAKAEGELSEAHSPTHLRNTARLTQLVGSIYGFTPQEAKLAFLAGSFHDLVRSPGEDSNSTDEERSASIAKDRLEAMNTRGIFITSEEERDAVVYAIENHGKKPAFFLDPQTREDVPQALPDRIHMALFVADKLEANGTRVIARRSSFVAGERLHRMDGDLRAFGFKPNKDEALVVAIESLLRLGIINPQSMYPEKLRAIVDPLYDVQREFVAGILASRDFSMKDVADLMLTSRRTDGKSILEARNLSGPADPLELAVFLTEKTGMRTDYLGLDPKDVAKSALEAVNYFSSHYQENLDTLIKNWNPKGRVAKRWKRLMVEYANGTWFKNMENDLGARASMSSDMQGLASAMAALDTSPLGRYLNDLLHSFDN